MWLAPNTVNPAEGIGCCAALEGERPLDKAPQSEGKYRLRVTIPVSFYVLGETEPRFLELEKTLDFRVRKKPAAAAPAPPGK